MTKRSSGQQSFQRAAPLLWNALPEDARNAETLGMFKCLLKTYYFERHYIFRMEYQQKCFHSNPTNISIETIFYCEATLGMHLHGKAPYKFVIIII